MRINYTPDDRFSPHDLPIRDCGNSGVLSAYIVYTDQRYLLALQVMRDRGLLPRYHRHLAKLRGEWHNMSTEIDRLRILAAQDYKQYWRAYQDAKQQRHDIMQLAEDTYNLMFFSSDWQARYKHDII